MYCILYFHVDPFVFLTLFFSFFILLHTVITLFSPLFRLTDLSFPPVVQKRRSGRQVKRRKYNEDLDFKVVDDDGETIAVLGAGRISALNATALAWQAEVGRTHTNPFVHVVLLRSSLLSVSLLNEQVI